MKFKDFCHSSSDSGFNYLLRNECDIRAFCCEMKCPVGEGIVSSNVLKEEERIFGKGSKKAALELMAKGAKPSLDFSGYFNLDENNVRKVYAPDYNGGYFLWKKRLFDFSGSSWDEV